MAIDVVHLGPVGAEIRGLRIGSLTADDARLVREAFEKHHVLVLRDHPLDEDELVRYAACFGRVTPSNVKSAAAGRGEVMIISNVRENGELIGSLPDGEVEWHFDRMHQKTPNKAAVLHAVEVPPSGGETVYADMCRAYEALPDATKRRIDGLRALHAYDQYSAKREARRLTGESPSAEHPVVRRLPDSGERAIWVSPLMTERILDVSDDESAALLDELFAQLRRSELIYEHRWRPGDSVVWDNRCMAHRRNDFDASYRRLMKRVAVEA